MAKRDFNEKDDEKLIKEIKNYRELYDRTHVDFHNSNAKTCAWDKVAEALGKPSKGCRSRWKDIRDNYVKYVRKGKIADYHSDPSRSSKWRLFDKLRFLNDIYRRQRPAYSNMQEDNTSDEDGSEHTPSGTSSDASNASSLSNSESDASSTQSPPLVKRRASDRGPNKKLKKLAKELDIDEDMNERSQPTTPVGCQKEKSKNLRSHEKRLVSLDDLEGKDKDVKPGTSFGIQNEKSKKPRRGASGLVSLDDLEDRDRRIKPSTSFGSQNEKSKKLRRGARLVSSDDSEDMNRRIKPSTSFGSQNEKSKKLRRGASGLVSLDDSKDMDRRMKPSTSVRSQKEKLGVKKLRQGASGLANRSKRCMANTEGECERDERRQKKVEISSLDEPKCPAKNKEKYEEDDVDLFMKSITMSVKKLPASLIRVAKLDILTCVTRLQERACSEQSAQSSFSNSGTTPHLDLPASTASTHERTGI